MNSHIALGFCIPMSAPGEAGEKSGVTGPGEKRLRGGGGGAQHCQFPASELTLYGLSFSPPSFLHYSLSDALSEHGVVLLHVCPKDGHPLTEKAAPPPRVGLEVWTAS